MSSSFIEQIEYFMGMMDSVLNIQNDTDYESAKSLLIDVSRRSMNGEVAAECLVRSITKAVASYEFCHSELKQLTKNMDDVDPGVSLMRLLMDQSNLGIGDLPEIGGRSTVHRILSGERKLSRKHIQILSERFHISPGLFF